MVFRWTTLGLQQNSIYKEFMANSALSMKGKVVLITGASRGIGRAGALQLADLGADLILVGRHRGRLEEVARLARLAGSPQVRVYVTDLTLREQVEELGRKLKLAEPKLDVLWNNAGGYFTERKVTEEGLERTESDMEQVREKYTEAQLSLEKLLIEFEDLNENDVLEKRLFLNLMH